jgi:hypothetical protein
MASHFKGPVKNAVQGNLGLREFFEDLPVGLGPEVVQYFNDFLFAQNYSASDWVVTETQAGATQAIAADELNGALLLTNDAGDDDVCQLQSAEEWCKLSAGKQLWFETKLKISDATQSDIFVGLATTDTSIIAGTTDSVGFRKLDGSTSVASITEDNTTETTTAGVHTIVADTYVTLGFHWNGVNQVKFFVNRSLAATHTANIEQTNKLAVTFTLQNGEAVAKTMTIDYIYVAQER